MKTGFSMIVTSACGILHSTALASDVSGSTLFKRGRLSSRFDTNVQSEGPSYTYVSTVRVFSKVSSRARRFNEAVLSASTAAPCWIR